MALRKSAKKTAQSDVDLEALFAAQDVSSSDDSAMMEVVAKQMQAAADKKSKARDAKLLQIFKTEADKLIVACAEKSQQWLIELKEDIDALVLAEADNEDKIRALWTEIGRMQMAHSDGMSRYAASVQKLEEQRLGAYATALHQVEAAYQDAESVANDLVAPTTK